MKLLFSSVLLATASMLSAATPQSAPPAPAAEPAPPSVERQQLARQYVQLTATADQFVDLFRAGMSKGISGKLDEVEDEESKAEARTEMAHFMSLAEPKLRERIPNLTEAYAQVYAREFSAEELRQMLAFAQSPAGGHFLKSRVKLELDPAILIQQEGFALDLFPILQQMQKEKCAAKAAQRVAMGEKNAKCPLSQAPETQAG